MSSGGGKATDIKQLFSVCVENPVGAHHHGVGARARSCVSVCVCVCGYVGGEGVGGLGVGCICITVIGNGIAFRHLIREGCRKPEFACVRV